jgi:hypothetical protein
VLVQALTPTRDLVIHVKDFDPVDELMIELDLRSVVSVSVLEQTLLITPLSYGDDAGFAEVSLDYSGD